MYEQMKNEFLLNLSNTETFSSDELNTILTCLDLSVYNYDILRKQTQIIPYNQELPEMVKMFIVSKSIEGYSEGTLNNYKRTLSNFFFTIQKSPEQITPNDIRVYLYNYQKERGISNRSLDKLRDCISSFYKWAYNEDYISKNPTLPIASIKYDKKSKVACTQTELEYLRRACETLKQKAILEVLYSTGCRVGELVILKKSDIDWNTKSVHLFGKGKKHRTSFLNAKAEVALKEYLETRTDNHEWVFVSDREPHDRMHVSGIQKIMRGISERANAKTGKHVTPHTLRHTMATRMMEANADITSIQQILGHSNINTTMTYIHTTLDNTKTTHKITVV